MSFALSDLPKREFRKILKLLEPKAFWRRATKLGDGEPVLGATAAMRERRAKIRKIINRYRKKHGRGLDIEIALLMRALGWPMFGQYRAPIPYQGSSFRRLAQAFWPNGATIPGGVYIDTVDADSSVLYRAVVRAVSQMFKDHPALNRAVLNNKVWLRSDTNIMMHVETSRDLWSPCFSAADRTDEWVKKRIARSVWSVARFSKKDLSGVALDLLIDWAHYGFLASSAAAMISMCRESDIGDGALVPANGIPLSITINRIQEDNTCLISCVPDHRAFDGKRDMELIYSYLRKEIPMFIWKRHEEEQNREYIEQ